MKILQLMLAVLILASTAMSKTGVSVTVYNQNLALVRDVRELDYKDGAGEILFRDVSGQIDATSVHFGASGVNLLEQNFDYDLVSSDKLLQKYIDQSIDVVTKEGDVAGGTLLTSSEGNVTLKQKDGSLRTILKEAITEIRYPSLPEGLITKPTLRWLVNSASAGKKETEVSYLTGGLNWRADYVMVLNQANTSTDLSAWVTIDNTCGASFKNAKLKLIAGEIHRSAQPATHFNKRDMTMRAAVAMDGGFEEKSFFEYHLYTLQRATDLLNNQTKQVSLFPNTETPVKKIYEYDWQKDNDNVSVSGEFENKKDNGLGMALPAGRVRVYQADEADGGQEFIGEDNIEHTPKDEKVRVTIGKAFDISAERAQMDNRTIADRVSEEDIQVKLRNHKTESVEIIVVDNLWGDWDITKKSSDFKKINSRRVEFPLTVAPDQEVILTYTIRHR